MKTVNKIIDWSRWNWQIKEKAQKVARGWESKVISWSILPVSCVEQFIKQEVREVLFSFKITSLMDMEEFSMKFYYGVNPSEETYGFSQICKILWKNKELIEISTDFLKKQMKFKCLIP